MANLPDIPKGRISPQFNARLAQLGEKDTVRAIVMLRSKRTGVSAANRQSRTERRAEIRALRESEGQALSEIDEILQHYDGRRLKDKVDVLGSIPVEAVPAGIRALAASEHVKAILEDQEISLLSGES